jgi:cytochrome P450
MPLYIPGIQFGLQNAVDELLVKNGPTNINKPSPFFQNFVAYMSVPSLIGDEFATNPDIIKSFAEFTGDIIKNMGFFLVLHKFMHKLVLPYVQSAKKHTKVMEDNVVPVIEQRREKMRLAMEAGEDHGLEANFLQGLIEFSDVDENGNAVQYNAVEMSHAILLVAFASVHTTSMNLSFSIYWLLARPDLMEKLIEEIDRVVPGNSPVTHAKLAEMKFLNNFIREVLRQGADRLANGKKALRDFTFANGYQVPKGETVESAIRALNFGDNVTRDTVEAMDPNMSRDKVSTTPARDFASFGMGKHLCPGKLYNVIIEKNGFIN